MNKYIFIISAMLIFSTRLFCQSITVKSIKNSNQNWDQDIKIEDASSSTSILQNTKIESSKTIYFSNTNVELDRVVILCDELVFESSVNTIIINGKVQIICKKIIFKNDPKTLNQLDIKKKDTDVSSFSVNSKNKYVNNRNIVFENDGNFSVSFLTK